MQGAPQSPRIASAADAGEVGRLLDRFQREYASFTPGAVVLTERVVAHMRNDASAFVLAGPPETGLAQLRFRQYLITGETVCTLEELYVAREQRRRGHGRAIVEAAFELARERGAASMELNTSADDTAARSLYAALGFTNLERPGDQASRMLYYERAL